MDNMEYELGLIPDRIGLEKSVPHRREMAISIKIHVITKKKKILGNSQKSFPIQKLSVFSVNYLDPEE